MKNKVNAKMLRRAAKILCRKLKVEGNGYVEVENPKIRTDFLYLKKIKNKGGNDEIRSRKTKNVNSS